MRERSELVVVTTYVGICERGRKLRVKKRIWGSERKVVNTAMREDSIMLDGQHQRFFGSACTLFPRPTSFFLRLFVTLAYYTTVFIRLFISR